MASTPSSPEGDRTLAAVAYILTWITGLIIFFVAKKDDHYTRWHAIQAIGYGIAATILYIVVSMLPVPFLGTIVWILIIVGVVVLAMKAYQGEKPRLPIVAEIADKNA